MFCGVVERGGGAVSQARQGDQTSLQIKHEALGRIPQVEYRVKQFPNLYY